MSDGLNRGVLFGDAAVIFSDNEEVTEVSITVFGK
jgi:hypothetical protein